MNKEKALEDTLNGECVGRKNKGEDSKKEEKQLLD